MQMDLFSRHGSRSLEPGLHLFNVRNLIIWGDTFQQSSYSPDGKITPKDITDGVLMPLYLFNELSAAYYDYRIVVQKMDNEEKLLLEHSDLRDLKSQYDMLLTIVDDKSKLTATR